MDQLQARLASLARNGRVIGQGERRGKAGAADAFGGRSERGKLGRETVAIERRLRGRGVAVGRKTPCVIKGGVSSRNAERASESAVKPGMEYHGAPIEPGVGSSAENLQGSAPFSRRSDR